MTGCTHCKNGWLGNRYGQDVECVNGVLIDIDVFFEGWQRDVTYPPAPCQACSKCRGSGERGNGQCRACKGTGWKSGQDESQERLEERAQPDNGGRDAIHNWFSLSYANYLAIPRSVLQSMPGEWQDRFVTLLNELSDTCTTHGIDLPRTEVRVRGPNGRWQEDPLSDYQRGRRNVFPEPIRPAGDGGATGREG